MAEIRAEITANVWQVVVEVGQMIAEGDEICILESMKMEIPVITEVPGVVRELDVEPGQTVQEGDRIALNAEMCDELRGHLEESGELRAIVITGAGTAFCAGADLVSRFASEGDA